MAINYPKEQMHRIAYTKLSSQQISAKLAAAASSGPKCASPLSTALSGKTMRIVTDKGLTLNYRFTNNSSLSLTEGTNAPVTGGYGALDLKPLIVFSHLVPGSQKSYHVIIDQRTTLATVFETWFSGYADARGEFNREVQREVHHGYVDAPGEQPPTDATTSRIGSRVRASTGSRTMGSRHSNSIRLRSSLPSSN